MSVSPPRPKGPPLNALRAFEAAARLGSFAAAAEELTVTAGAISQQIKTVEHWAGNDLFKRHAQGVSLTQDGARLLPSLSRAFDEIATTTALIRANSPKRELNIATLPSIAQLWLQPRLARARAALGGVSLSVYALEDAPDMSRALFDCSLFLRVPTGADTEIVLARDALMPVCAPAMAARLRQPSDLASETLLYDESWQGDWHTWAKATGHRLGEGQRARYSLYTLALADALAGFGVLLGHRVLVQDALDAGKLVAPFDPEVDLDTALVFESAPTAQPKSITHQFARALAS